VLSEALDVASTNYLMDNHSPSRNVGELDNRGTHVYLGTAWARAIADQTDNAELAERFRPVAEALEGSLEQILQQLVDAQGPAMDIGGYYQPDIAKASAAMRPSPLLNEIVDGLLAPA